MSDVSSWVIGRGGLLGRSVERALRSQGTLFHPDGPTHWEDADRAASDLNESCRRFAAEVRDGAWQIAWCAGSGIVGSGSEPLQRETRILASFLSQISAHFENAAGSRGALFLASSAGGVYAGARGAPFDEHAPVAPLAPYGWSKLEQEEIATAWSQRTRTALLIGRLSNLYGPGQNLNKAQGLITQLCLRSLMRQSLSLYVPLDTIRDYLFVDDAGRIVSEALRRLRLEHAATGTAQQVTKIMASQQAVTLATILSDFRAITKRPVRVTIGASPASRGQARDLRFVSRVWPEIDEYPTTTLSEGIRHVYTDLLRTAHGGVIGS